MIDNINVCRYWANSEPNPNSGPACASIGSNGKLFSDQGQKLFRYDQVNSLVNELAWLLIDS